MSTADDRAGGGGPADASLDPRTWLKPSTEAETKRPPAGETAAEGPPPGEPAAASFDPKSWAAGGKTTGPAAAPRSQPPLALLGAAAAVLVLGGAGAVWLLNQPDAPVPAPKATTPTPAAAVPAVPTPGLETRTLTISGPGELAGALSALGVDPADAAAASAAAAAQLAGAGELKLEAALAGVRLESLELVKLDGSRVSVARDPAGAFAAKAVAADVRMALRVARGELDAESFYSSAVAAGVNDALIPAFAQAFTFDFDFQRELKPGDVFEAVYEEAVNADGTPAASGVKRLLYVSLATAEKSRALYSFKPPGEAEAGWFDGAGKSVVRSIMRTPVEGARVSSSFGPRLHPIRGYVKNHNGTDFAAPQGTPIYASGSGVVEFAAMKGCNGNFTILRHDNPANWQTYYLHQVRFADGIAPGVRVAQGQKIGEVGTTGCSTGPHLHYEVRIDGQPTDPMKIEVSEGRALSGEAMAAFVKERDRIDQLRQQAL
jgi:murein DD-endopeptidase MepM/ murein hydrolase activator NlpD